MGASRPLYIFMHGDRVKRRMRPFKRPILYFWIGMTVTFFFSLPYLSTLTLPWSRLELAWTRWDALCLLIVLFVGGSIVGMVGAALRHGIKSDQVFSGLLLLGFFLAI